MTQHNPTHFNHSHVHSVCGKGEGKREKERVEYKQNSRCEGIFWTRDGHRNTTGGNKSQVRERGEEQAKR